MGLALFDSPGACIDIHSAKAVKPAGLGRLDAEALRPHGGLEAKAPATLQISLERSFQTSITVVIVPGEGG